MTYSEIYPCDITGPISVHLDKERMRFLFCAILSEHHFTWVLIVLPLKSTSEKANSSQIYHCKTFSSLRRGLLWFAVFHPLVHVMFHFYLWRLDERLCEEMLLAYCEASSFSELLLALIQPEWLAWNMQKCWDREALNLFAKSMYCDHGNSVRAMGAEHHLKLNASTIWCRQVWCEVGVHLFVQAAEPEN